MYSEESLRRYPFFRELLDSGEISKLHNSLTGLISRPYILRFIQRLIQDGEVFTLAILDLDNFKSVNDNYGHTTGDAVLRGVAADIQTYLGERGLAGRFGGDEFLLVLFGNQDYQAVYEFFLGMCGGQAVFRRITDYGGVKLTITATMGIARFPQDADSFEGIFSTADKALYRGKCKGRNCFIIYLAEKHAHLEIPALTQRSLYKIFRAMASEFDQEGSLCEKLSRAFAPMRTGLHMTRLFYVDGVGAVWNASDGEKAAQTADLDSLLADGLFASPTLAAMKGSEPELYQVLTELGVESTLIVRVGGEGDGRGCLIACPEEHNMRIWQDEDSAALFFLSRLAHSVLMSDVTADGPAQS